MPLAGLHAPLGRARYATIEVTHSIGILARFVDVGRIEGHDELIAEVLLDQQEIEGKKVEGLGEMVPVGTLVTITVAGQVRKVVPAVDAQPQVE